MDPDAEADIEFGDWAAEYAKRTEAYAVERETGLRLALLQQLQGDPTALYRRAARELKPYAFAQTWRCARPRIQVGGSDSLLVNAVTEPAPGFRPGYRIRVNRGLTLLLFDAVQLTLARTKVVSRAGFDAVDPDLEAGAASAILEKTVAGYVTRRAYQTDAELEEAWRARIERERSMPYRRWRDWPFLLEQMVRLVVAHELGHITLNHLKFPGGNPHADEFSADAEAARILLSFTKHQAPDWARDRQAYGGMLGDARSLKVATLGTAAILFTLLDFITRAARSLHAAGLVREVWGASHPPGLTRYHKFRQFCVNQDIASVVEFDVMHTDFPPPHTLRWILALLLLDLSWGLGDPELPHSGPPAADSELPAWARANLKALRDEPGKSIDPTAGRRALGVVRRELALRLDLQAKAEDPEVRRALIEVLVELVELCAGRLGALDDALNYIELANMLLSGSYRDPAIEGRLSRRWHAIGLALGYPMESLEAEERRGAMVGELVQRLNDLRALGGLGL